MVETVDPVSNNAIIGCPCSNTSLSVALPNSPGGGGSLNDGVVVGPVDLHKPSDGPSSLACWCLNPPS